MHQETATPHEVKLPGEDRILTYDIAGDPHGLPVFLHHGMPGSVTGPRPRNAVLYRLGVKLVSYNRPGYGRSTRKDERTVADAATDVLMLAQHLGHERFSVMGRSGGGPHALACAALLPDNVVRAAVLVSFAPADAPDLEWYREMVGSNVESYQDVSRDRAYLIETLRIRAELIWHDPAHLLDQLRAEMTETDARIVDNAAMHELLLKTYKSAVSDGPYGWIDDVIALRENWGFKPEDVRVPVHLWHGEDDRFAPASHTRWLAERIPGATVEVQAGAAHFGALPVVPRLLEWLVEPRAEFGAPEPKPGGTPGAGPDLKVGPAPVSTDAGPARGADSGSHETPPRPGVLARAGGSVRR